MGISNIPPVSQDGVVDTNNQGQRLSMLKPDEIGDSSVIIAEVGQNHQGQLDIALEYVKVFAQAGADVIKFQTRNNAYLFSPDALSKEYNSNNAFGVTYGEHREFLELKPEWLPLLRDACHKQGVQFMSTPFDEPSLGLLLSIDVDLLKIASFDIGNIPFIERIAKSGKPVVLSTGGAGMDCIKKSCDTVLRYIDDVAIMHCVSEYPCSHERLGLNRIRDLMQLCNGHTVGLSDHFNGILSGPVAYMLGARVFEKHVTLNRTWRGTDHCFSLEPEGFRKFTRDIRRVTQMLGNVDESNLGNEPVFKKLGKSLAANTDIKAGTILTAGVLTGIIFPDTHIPVREASNIIGRIITVDVAKGSPILMSNVQ